MTQQPQTCTEHPTRPAVGYIGLYPLCQACLMTKLAVERAHREARG